MAGEPESVVQTAARLTGRRLAEVARGCSAAVRCRSAERPAAGVSAVARVRAEEAGLADGLGGAGRVLVADAAKERGLGPDAGAVAVRGVDGARTARDDVEPVVVGSEGETAGHKVEAAEDGGAAAGRGVDAGDGGAGRLGEDEEAVEVEVEADGVVEVGHEGPRLAVGVDEPDAAEDGIDDRELAGAEIDHGLDGLEGVGHPERATAGRLDAVEVAVGVGDHAVALAVEDKSAAPLLPGVAGRVGREGAGERGAADHRGAEIGRGVGVGRCVGRCVVGCIRRGVGHGIRFGARVRVGIGRSRVGGRILARIRRPGAVAPRVGDRGVVS